MKHLKKATLAASVFAVAATFSLGWSEQGGLSLSVESAQARVGRPLTPMSGAGVARRHARRGAYGVGAAGAAAVGAAALGTAAAVAGAPYAYGAYQGYGTYQEGGPYGVGMGPYGYHQSWDDYAKQNGIACRPGTTIKLDDGRTYPCQ
ncbi:MAG: hypothetical protein JO052_27965 [Bradyrhizobium sp.]|nr:hypothetical protein [Bradyrhizobium sp.]